MADDSSQFEMTGRAHVAGLLERWIARELIPIERISQWSEDLWLAAAVEAGVPSAVKRNKVPSAKTQGQVIGLVTGRYQRMAERQKASA